MKVYTTTYDHNHGTDFNVHSSLAEVHAYILGVLQEAWDEGDPYPYPEEYTDSLLEAYLAHTARCIDWDTQEVGQAYQHSYLDLSLSHIKEKTYNLLKDGPFSFVTAQYEHGFLLNIDPAAWNPLDEIVVNYGDTDLKDIFELALKLGANRVLLDRDGPVAPELKVYDDADTLRDGEVLGLDKDGTVIQWDSEEAAPYNCGLTPEEFDVTSMTKDELKRISGGISEDTLKKYQR